MVQFVTYRDLKCTRGKEKKLSKNEMTQFVEKMSECDELHQSNESLMDITPYLGERLFFESPLSQTFSIHKASLWPKITHLLLLLVQCVKSENQ